MFDQNGLAVFFDPFGSEPFFVVGIELVDGEARVMRLRHGRTAPTI